MEWIRLVGPVLFLCVVYIVFLKGLRKSTQIQIFNETKNIFLAERAVGAYTFARRTTGLLNHVMLNENCGIHIQSARLIHTRGMRFAIDIIFLDRKGLVVKIFDNISPNATETYFGGVKAKSVVEVNAGTCRRTQTEVNDLIRINPV